MSIDARVSGVYLIGDPEGSGHLILIDRPPNRRGDSRGIAGQRKLYFDSSPDDVGSLRGRDVWGDANDLMLGDRKIADRLSYTRIQFVVDQIEEKG